MDKNQTTRSNEEKKEAQPGNMESFNQRNAEKSTEAEGAGKDESESYMDYNGNSEANAPARATEGEGK